MADAQVDTSIAINELINLKSKIEQESFELSEERSKLSEKLKSLKQEKKQQLSSYSDLFQKLVFVRLEEETTQMRVQDLANHVHQQKSMNDMLESDITEQLNLSAYAEKLDEVRSSIESAVLYYSDDNLQMEIMKRSNGTRDLRVELTRITNEIQQRRKEVDEEMAEKRRLEKAKLERQRQEEERKRLVAEDKARATMRFQSPARTPDLPVGNFRNVAFANQTAELAIKKPFPRDSSLLSDIEKRLSFDSSSKKKCDNSVLPSFSQVTKGW